MGKLTYLVLGSLDGYFEDADGRFEWAAPDEEVHAYVNDLSRPIGTYLYGRRMYDTMKYWETASTDGEPAAFRDYADIWRAADKVVYSRTLEAPTTSKTRIERELDPEAVRQLKESSSGDLAIGGGELAGQAMRAGLVDELHVFLSPIVVGGGKRSFPADVTAELTLRDERRFDSGFVHLHYGVNV